MSNLVLLCRRHHVLWHLGKIGLRDLRVAWLTDPTAAPPPPPRTTGPPRRAEREIPLFDLVGAL